MNLTKKLLHTAILTGMIFTLSGCFYKTLEPSELKKAQEISIKGTSYVPEYKGLDACYLAEEELVLGNKENWYIHNKKLYLFTSESSKEKWFIHITMVKEAADKYWESINAPTEDEKFEDMTDAFMNGSSY